MSAPVTAPDLAARVEVLAAEVARLATAMEEIRVPLAAVQLTVDALLAAGRQRWAEGYEAGREAARPPRGRRAHLRPVPSGKPGGAA